MDFVYRFGLKYVAAGLIISVITTYFFDEMPAWRFLSNEALVFGIMAATMLWALKDLEKALKDKE